MSARPRTTAIFGAHAVFRSSSLWKYTRMYSDAIKTITVITIITMRSHRFIMIILAADGATLAPSCPRERAGGAYA